MRNPGALLLILFLFVSSANALVVGPEVAVTPPVYLPASPVAAFAPLVASDGSDYLVLWNAGNFPYETNAAIVSPAGDLTTVPQRPLFFGYGVLDAVWNGSSYLLAGFTTDGRSMIVARVGRDATLLDAPHVVQQGGITPRSLAWNGHNYLLTYTNLIDGSGGALLLSPAGDVVRNVTSSFALPRGARPVAVGDTFYVVGAVNNALTIFRVSGAGDVLDPQPVTVAALVWLYSFDVAASARTIVVAAVENQVNAVRTLAVDPATLEITSNPIAGAGPPYAVSIASGGSAFLMSTTRAGFGVVLQMLPLNDDGSPAAPLGQPCCIGSGERIALASNGSTYFGAWVIRNQIVGSIFTPDGNAAGQRVVSIAASEQTHPARAGSLLVWREATVAGTEIRAVRMGPNGAVGDPIAVSQSTAQDDVAVTFTGSLYFIAWTEQPDSSDAHVVMRRFRSDLTPIDAAPLTIAPSPSNTVSLATDGTRALAVWYSTAIRAVRLPDLGNVLDTPVTLVARGGLPRVAWNGSEYLVAWTSGSACNQFACPPNGLDVDGARLAADATLIDPTPLVIATGPTDQILQAIASNGRDFVVGYRSSDSSTFRIQLRLNLRHVDPNGTVGRERVLGPLPFSSPIAVPPVGPPMAIVRNGAGYIVAYESAADETEPLDLHIAHVDDVISGDVVFSTSGDWAEFALQDDSAIVAYTRYADDPQYGGVHRLFTRTFASEPRIRLVHH